MLPIAFKSFVAVALPRSAVKNGQVVGGGELENVDIRVINGFTGRRT